MRRGLRTLDVLDDGLRVIYAAGYMAEPDKRSTGFLIQFVASMALLIGALGKIVYSLAMGGA